jgi:hypothetical protein
MMMKLINKTMGEPKTILFSQVSEDTKKRERKQLARNERGETVRKYSKTLKTFHLLTCKLKQC